MYPLKAFYTICQRIIFMFLVILKIILTNIQIHIFTLVIMLSMYTYFNFYNKILARISKL